MCALSQKGSKHPKDISVRRGGGWGREETAVYAKPPVWVSSERENCYEIHTPCTVHTTVGIPRHMQDGGDITMDGWKGFTVFLTAFDFNTSASLPTAVSQTLTATRGMQITWGRKWELCFRAIRTQRLPTTQFLFLPHALLLWPAGRQAGRQVRVFSPGLCFSLHPTYPLGFRETKNPQHEIED